MKKYPIATQILAFTILYTLVLPIIALVCGISVRIFIWASGL